MTDLEKLQPQRICERCGAKSAHYANFCHKDGWQLGVAFHPVRDEIPMWGQIQQAIARSQTEIQGEIVNLRIEVATLKHLISNLSGDIVCQGCNRVYRLGQVPGFCGSCGKQLQGGQS